MMVIGLLLIVFFAVPALAQNKDWEREWNKILTGAKKEGKVVVKGDDDPDTRRELPAKFTARFGIPVEYIGGSSTGIAARLRSEFRAGLHSIDVFVGGMGTLSTILYPEKMLDPLKPVLLVPEVTDPSNWKKGKLWFVDPEEKYVLRLFSTVGTLFEINNGSVSRAEFKSIKDLLNPKWKGRISVADPAAGGAGSGIAAKLYAQFGEEFVKRLYIDQSPVVTRNRRQMADWLARGTYPISIYAGSSFVRPLLKEGFPILTITSLLPDAPGSLSSGSGQVVLMKNAPHPNAARLFINWMASKEGVEIYARTQTSASTRSDIDESFLPAEEIPRPGVNYFESDNWEFKTLHEEKFRLHMQELLKR